MSFNKKLLDIIACPVCKGKLVLHQVDDEEKSGATMQLVCRFDRLAYSIEEGIPVLLDSASKELSLEELEKVKKHD